MTEHTQQPQKKRSWGKTFLKTCAFLLGLILMIDLIAKDGGSTATELPKCDSDKAIRMVKDAVGNNVLKRHLNIKVLAVKNIQTLKPTDSELKEYPEGFVKCKAKLITNFNKADRIYTFEWIDKDKGQYYIEVKQK